MLATIAHNGATKLYPNLRYDPNTELQPVILVAESPSVLLVRQDLAAKSVSELLALMKAQPGKLSYGSAGNGSAMHMAAELFRYMSKTEVVHVPYRGGAPRPPARRPHRLHVRQPGHAHQHLPSGRCALTTTSTTRNQPARRAHRGRPAYPATRRCPGTPSPRGVPAAVVNKLNTEINGPEGRRPGQTLGRSLGVVVLGDARRGGQAQPGGNQKWSAVIEPRTSSWTRPPCMT